MKIIVDGNYIETDYICSITKINNICNYDNNIMKLFTLFYFDIILIDKKSITISIKIYNEIEYTKSNMNYDIDLKDCIVTEAKQNLEDLRTKLFDIWSENQSCIPNLKLKELNYKIEE